MFSWAYYKAHADAGAAPACHAERYGCYGIHVFDVPGRSGMGVHSGRTKGEPEQIGGKTLGCIRVTNGAMETINAVHASDRLHAIVVE